MYKNKKGFTLLELSVVLSSMALLLAASLPALNRSRNQAKSTVCMSNLKQLGICFSLYAEDNAGSFLDGVNYSMYDPTWIDTFQPYYADIVNVRCCPMITQPIYLTNPAYGTSRTDWVYYPPDYGSYAVNGWACNPEIWPSGWGEASNLWRNGNQAGTNNIPIFADGLWFHAAPENGDRPSAYSDRMSNPLSSMQRVCSDRHGGTTNVCFMDSSVRSIGLKQLWKLKWHRNYDVDARDPYWPAWMNEYSQ